MVLGSRELACRHLFRGLNFRGLPINRENWTPRKFPAIRYSEYDVIGVKLRDGEAYSHATTSNTTCSVLSSEAVMVAQLSEGGEAEDFGDPLALVVAPTEQYHLCAQFPTRQ